MNGQSVAVQRFGGKDPLTCIEYWVKHTPDKTCLQQPAGEGHIDHYTWKDIDRECRRVAAYLKELRLPVGSRVAILSKNCAHWIMSDIAIWMAGYVSVPLYPTLSADMIKDILEHSESSAIFVGKLDDPGAALPGIPEHLHKIAYAPNPEYDFPDWKGVVARTQPLGETSTITGDSVATIVYTSGTTGQPKGVVHTFEGFGRCGPQAVDLLGLSEHDRCFSYLPLSHVAERLFIETVLFYASPCVYFCESLETFSRDLKQAAPTLFLAVPRIWGKFQQKVGEKLPERRLKTLLKIPVINRLVRRKLLSGLGLQKTRLCFSGAAPLAESVIHWYRGIGIEILEAYGLTENYGYSHISRPGHAKVGYVGQPAPGVTVKVEASGEILVKSPMTMREYYKMPEQTQAVLTDDGFFKTGDIGEIAGDGSLKITGRIKDIFKTSKGKYVAPAPIENQLLANPAIEQVCVVGVGLPQPVALVTLQAYGGMMNNEANVKTSLLDTLQKVNNQLPAHECLKALCVISDEWSVESGELTPTLKLKRNLIEARYADQLASWYETGGVLFDREAVT